MRRTLLVLALVLVTAIASAALTSALSNVGSRPFGISLLPWGDPAGNNQESYQLAFTAPDGTVSYSGVFAQVHAGQKIRLFVVATGPDPNPAFEICPGNSTVVITGPYFKNCP